MAPFKRSLRAKSPAPEPVPAPEPAIELRSVDRARARAIVARRLPPGEHWAEGYPSDGDLEAAGMLLRTLRAGVEVGPFGMYEILERSTDCCIGGIGFHKPPGPDGRVEVGYGLVPSVWNRGYATAALNAIIAIAFEHGATYLEGRALPDNLASRRVMEKAGMRFIDVVEGYARYRIGSPPRP